MSQTDTQDFDMVADEEASEADPKIAQFMAPGFDFLGKRIPPISAARMAAAQRAGLLFGTATPEETEEFIARGSYPGLFSDIILLLYIAQAPEQEVSDVFLGPRSARALGTKSFAWANANNICFPNSVFEQARAIFFAMMGGANSLPQMAPPKDSEDKDPEKKESGPAGSPSTSRKSRHSRKAR